MRQCDPNRKIVRIWLSLAIIFAGPQSLLQEKNQHVEPDRMIRHRLIERKHGFIRHYYKKNNNSLVESFKFPEMYYYAISKLILLDATFYYVQQKAPARFLLLF